MKLYQQQIEVATNGQGTYEITQQLANHLDESSLENGLLTVFCKHTSCSLVIMENADPSARKDLHYFFEKLVPTDDPNYTHTLEGPDDMTSHIKMALTRTSETIPFSQSRLCLGTWQGVFLWEHRYARHTRQIHLSFLGE